jgi:hypothetical protein
MRADAPVTAVAVFAAEVQRARERPPALPPELAHLAPDGVLERLAVHESGHAIAEFALGYGVVSASIEGSYDSGGRVIPRTPKGAPIRDRIITLLAGGEAEKCAWPALYFNECSKLDALDLGDARFFAAVSLETLPTDPRVPGEVERWRPAAARIVRRHFGWIERVARELVAWRRVSGDRILQLRGW